MLIYETTSEKSSQTPKTPYCITPFLGNSAKEKSYLDRKKSVFLRARVERRGLTSAEGKEETVQGTDTVDLGMVS